VDRGSRTFGVASLSAGALVLLQAATPPPGVGPDQLVDYWPLILRAGWFFAGFFAVVLLSRVFVEPAIVRLLRRRNRNNPTLQDAIRRYVRLLVLVVGVFVGAGVAGYGRILSTSALVIGAATLAIGVAAQEVIGSIVSGIALVFDPEFNVGDYIEWSGGAGIVQSITLRVTRVETQNGELVTIPNTVLTSEPITMPFGRGDYRIMEHIGLAYEDDVDEAMARLEAAASGLDKVLPEPAPRAYIDEFGDEAVIVRVHYWIESPDRRDVFEIRSAYARAVKTEFENAGITISPPSQHDLQGRITIDRTG
jgi:small-conductance mechanosensitive channel